MAAESHEIMDGQVHVYRRERSKFWQCAVYLGGKNHRQSTRQSNLAFAVAFGKDGFIERGAADRLRQPGEARQADRHRRGLIAEASAKQPRKAKPKKSSSI